MYAYNVLNKKRNLSCSIVFHVHIIISQTKKDDDKYNIGEEIEYGKHFLKPLEKTVTNVIDGMKMR